MKKQTQFIAVSLALSAMLFLFQNCDRPYNLALDNPSDENQSNSSTPALLINGGAKLTNSADLELTLHDKYAQEVSISSSPNCRDEWIPYAEKITKQWVDGDGVANLYVRFRNFRKEESPCHEAKITIDTTPPEVSFVTKVNVIDNSHNPTFTVDAIESLSGLARLECLIRKKTASAGSYTACTKDIQMNGLEDDTYVLQVRAVDVAGNVSAPTSHEWTIDSRAPTLNVTTKPALFTSSTQQPFVFSIQNAVGGNTTINCRMNSQAPTNCTSPWNATAAANALNTATIEVRNAAGNVAQFTYQFTVDTVAPTLTIQGGPENFDTSSTARITFTSSDGSGSGIASYRCRFDGGAEIACSNSNAHTISGLTDGPHSLAIVAIDRAGNRSATRTYSWTSDIEPASLSTGLLGHWKLDDSSGTVAVDALGLHDGTLVNLQASPWMPTGGHKQGAILFNGGSSARIDVGDNFDFVGNAPFSVSIWIYRNAGGGDYISIMSKSLTDTAGRQGFSTSLCNTCAIANRGFACARYRDGANSTAVDTTGAVPVGQWTHLACTYDGIRMRVYRNGAMVGASSASTLSMINHTGSFMIGSASGNNGFLGRLDAARVYNRALTDEEILFLAK